MRAYGTRRGAAASSSARGRAHRLAMSLALVSVVLVAAGCAGGGRSERPSPSAPASGTLLDEAIPTAVAELPLVDQHGRRFTLASLRGKTVVLADFLTLCQEICPLTSVNLHDVAEAVQRDGQSPDVEVVEATVDPARDTVPRLAAYEKLFGPQEAWTLATGNQHGLDNLWAFLGVYQKKVKENGSPAPRDWWTGAPLTYDVEHQDVVYVIDAHGHARWMDNGTPNTMGERPTGPMLRFLSAEGRRNLTSPADPTWTVRDVEQAVTYVAGKRLG